MNPNIFGIHSAGDFVLKIQKWHSEDMPFLSARAQCGRADSPTTDSENGLADGSWFTLIFKSTDPAVPDIYEKGSKWAVQGQAAHDEISQLRKNTLRLLIR